MMAIITGRLSLKEVISAGGIAGSSGQTTGTYSIIIL
ncbi:hypothetical protein BN1232_06396 [Mycobacterium lentiflavum]|uniref:Uncharacterized protein n=1 Tax=Mycobacterium lentiflavum TaxID=141349 RepID=A0A0E4H666_MYCLN|nr:hypothetical protein BN1232_06396 [Mycobacterium lentiflavum]